jgi:hypothetical protein
MTAGTFTVTNGANTTLTFANAFATLSGTSAFNGNGDGGTSVPFIRLRLVFDPSII